MVFYRVSQRNYCGECGLNIESGMSAYSLQFYLTINVFTGKERLLQ